MAKDLSVQQYDAVIIGAGAAGLFCAAMAGRRGRKVLVLEHMAAPGAKIVISGGGRCNFTNMRVAAKNFISQNPHFAKSALAGFGPDDFIALVKAHGIAFHEKRLGQLFCDRSAKDILAMLLAMCDAAGVELRLGQRVTAVSKATAFRVATDHGEVAATALVLATGGLSIPKMGATGFTHDIARQFGLPLTALRAGLVPFIFEGEARDWMQGLSGVAVPVLAHAGKTAFAEAALFTHRGLSGPAILQISSYWQPGDAVRLDLLAGQDAYQLLLAGKRARPKAALKTILAELLPARLAEALAPAEMRVMAEIPHAALQAVAAKINGLSLRPVGTEGYAKAEVTVGGVDTACLSSKSMAARDVPGLFVIGEAVDVTGWLGGYNFQWAWSSGYAAAMAV